ncbi:MAG TPA: hypothetical protein EYN67_08605 [Flavobacteriales bacterium]|nr:hypothetical protein [Flavobacteriales bacterium]
MAYGRRFGRRSFSRNRRNPTGQGRMRAESSGSVPLIRHSVNIQDASIQTLADGKAYAFPLVVYYATSAATDNLSSSASISKDSRVNNIGINLSINQSDSTAPNQCYVGVIAVSFSEAALASAVMTTNFADLISMSNTTTGTMNLYNGAKSLRYDEWTQSAVLRHNVRGFQRNTYTLYSGRPALLKSTLRVPGKCKRGQFGMGYFLVVMNDSSVIQNVNTGSATDVNVGLTTFFKEIPPSATAET